MTICDKQNKFRINLLILRLEKNKKNNNNNNNDHETDSKAYNNVMLTCREPR